MWKVSRPSFPLIWGGKKAFFIGPYGAPDNYHPFLCYAGSVLVTFKVKTIGAFKEIIGSKEIELSLKQGTTLKELLADITEKWGESLQSKLFEPGTTTLFPYIRLMVNGQDIAFLNRMETEIQEGDEVLILPPAYGG